MQQVKVHQCRSEDFFLLKSAPRKDTCVGKMATSRMVLATAAVSAGSLAFVMPSQSAKSTPSTPSLRTSAAASVTSASSASGSTLGVIGAAAISTVGLTMVRQGRRAAARQAVGVCLPLTEKFDPLELGNTDAKMDRYTQVEIKHGRVAMIATMGYIMPEIFRFPGCEAFKHGLGAFESIPVEGWVQLVALVGAHEVLVKPREGGLGAYDFGLGTELLDGIDAEELERKQTSERNNGRLAMIAIMGLMVQDGMFGEPPLTYMQLKLSQHVRAVFLHEGVVQYGTVVNSNHCGCPRGNS